MSRPARAQRGLWAEAAAAAYLQRQGYTVLARRYWVPAGEVDLVAREGDVLAFVEVRFRSDGHEVPPLSTLGPRKQARIVRAARAYVARLTGPWPPMRFDAVGIWYASPQLGAEANLQALRAFGASASCDDGALRASPTLERARDALAFTLVRGAFDAAFG